eukprot:7137404-Lingulodinium_polyedra.AAC.1
MTKVQRPGMAVRCIGSDVACVTIVGASCLITRAVWTCACLLVFPAADARARNVKTVCLILPELAG